MLVYTIALRALGNQELTRVAAKALNAALGTKLFAPGLALGTASTKLRF